MQVFHGVVQPLPARANLWLRCLHLLIAGSLLALLAAFALPAGARTVLDLDTQQQPVPLLDWGDWWIDDTASVPVEGVQASAQWQPTVPHGIYRFSVGQTLWVRFTIPPAPDHERWYLEVPSPVIDVAALYTQDSAGRWIEMRAGDSVPVAQWPVPHRHPLLPVQVSAEEPRTYLLRLQSPNGFGADLRFISESQLSRTEQRVSLVLGIYFGLTGLAAVLAALSALSLRDWAYALYTPYVVFMALTQACLTGIAGLHLWPHWAWWADAASTVLPVLAVASVMAFVAAAVSLHERSRALLALVLALAGSTVLAGVTAVLVNASWRAPITVPFIVASELLALGVLLWSWRRGDRHAPWIALGLSPVILLSTLPMLRGLGLVTHGALALHGMQIAHAIELPIMLVALMLRSQQWRENRRRIRGLDRIDPATGLINQQVFLERMTVTLARAQRMQQPAAVLLVDIANYDTIVRDFGRKSAEELPLRVAGRLLSAARDIDSVARLGELRFGMLVEGPLQVKDVGELGPRIVARCLRPYADKHVDWTAQVRVAVGMAPHDGDDPEQLMRKLEAMLLSVPPESRRAVFSSHDFGLRG